jgi:ERO1-like protein alpha
VTLKGVVDDCCCKAEKVDSYNTAHITSVLSKLTKTEFFKYFKVNYLKPCPFWAENYLCSMTEGGGCGICECKEEEIPKPWVQTPKEIDVNTKVDSNFIKSHNDASDIWCDCDDDEKNMVYINLLLNPERYTGYVGYNATRIWAAIYAENCFQSKGENGLCLEERTLNRLISGFHGSTTAHICEMYYKDGEWVPNVEMFAWKLGREEAFLKNIYFTYLFLARSISKIRYCFFVLLFFFLLFMYSYSDTLMQYDYNTGKPAEDAKTRSLVSELLKVNFVFFFFFFCMFKFFV